MHIEHKQQFFEGALTLVTKAGQSGFVTTDTDWFQSPMYSSYSRLYFVLEGEGMLVSENEQMKLESGYVYLAPMGLKHGFYGTPSVTKLFFHINLSYGKDGGDVFMTCQKFLRIPCPPERIRKLLGYYLSENKAQHLALMSEIYRTVYEFLKQTEARAPLPSGDAHTLAVAVQYIHSHLHAALAVKEVAQAALCSYTKLSSLFLAALGQSVSRYIEDLVMNEAQNMLMYSDLNIGQISEQLGFCDQFYFSRRFAKRFGVSPKKFRKQG